MHNRICHLPEIKATGVKVCPKINEKNELPFREADPKKKTAETKEEINIKLNCLSE